MHCTMEQITIDATAHGASASAAAAAPSAQSAPAPRLISHHMRVLMPPVRYTQRLPLSQGIAAERHDTCGISYPMLNVVNGQPFVYYAFVHSSGFNEPLRSAIVPK